MPTLINATPPGQVLFPSIPLRAKVVRRLRPVFIFLLVCIPHHMAIIVIYHGTCMRQSFTSDAEEDLVLRATTALFVPCPSKKMVGGS